MHHPRRARPGASQADARNVRLPFQIAAAPNVNAREVTAAPVQVLASAGLLRPSTRSGEIKGIE
jgi:hypothetical protein